ncbi:hypothetical protein MJO28_006653 [Puccinia striiformis f. sp. tritici]|uniref:Uncharacterized protein n=1 Tax=Puccinia striiformis f. sp. tritici TaxID=168172 RepID=A0ACC0EHN7_9BASI|nr:hypothetical protein Pst134EB_012791 [Puccinia striiformis f. sp. tritici]KAI7954106.1 hypothetical protein MJO28_006653 [Puccinia striiformis f. sp. tritici]KAI9629357.1 hypothetical protein KEM48_013023 [Puccinia striiformis f. sp. tritici PST-130]
MLAWKTSTSELLPRRLSSVSLTPARPSLGDWRKPYEQTSHHPKITPDNIITSKPVDGMFKVNKAASAARTPGCSEGSRSSN